MHTNLAPSVGRWINSRRSIGSRSAFVFSRSDPKAERKVEFAARLVGDKGVKAAKIFTAAGDAKGKLAEEIVAALGHAFQTAAADLVLWTITEAESDQSERSPKPL